MKKVTIRTTIIRTTLMFKNIDTADEYIFLMQFLYTLFMIFLVIIFCIGLYLHCYWLFLVAIIVQKHKVTSDNDLMIYKGIYQSTFWWLPYKKEEQWS